MNEGFISRSNNSNITMYTPIKIKNKDNLYNKNNLVLRPNTSFHNQYYLNQNNNNMIKSNNIFTKNKIKKNNLLSNSNDFIINNLSNKKIGNMKKRKSLSIISNNINSNKSYKYKNKSTNNFNLLSDMQRYKYNNNIKRKKLFTYNFNKDTQSIHCSTIIFKKKNKSTYHRTYDSTDFLNLLNDSEKSRNLKDNKNKNLKKYYILNKSRTKNMNNKYNKSSNVIKNLDINQKKREHSYNNNFFINLNNTNLNIKKKLIDSPDSIFYYIYNYIHEKNNTDYLEQKIYFSKINMIKKFRHYKKDLEKLEQRTNFEVFNLKRQIIPGQDSKLPKKILSNI